MFYPQLGFTSNKFTLRLLGSICCKSVQFCSKYIVTIPSPILKNKNGVSALMLTAEKMEEISPYFSPFAVPQPWYEDQNHVKNENPVSCNVNDLYSNKELLQIKLLH
jgi:hypothetical protein